MGGHWWLRATVREGRGACLLRRGSLWRLWRTGAGTDAASGEPISASCSPAEEALGGAADPGGCVQKVAIDALDGDRAFLLRAGAVSRLVKRRQ